MSGFKREDPTTEEIANELYRRSRLSEAKLGEDLGFTGIRKPKPAWLSQLEEEDEEEESDEEKERLTPP